MTISRQRLLLKQLEEQGEEFDVYATDLFPDEVDEVISSAVLSDKDRELCIQFFKKQKSPAEVYAEGHYFSYRTLLRKKKELHFVMVQALIKLLKK